MVWCGVLCCDSSVSVHITSERTNEEANTVSYKYLSVIEGNMSQ